MLMQLTIPIQARTHTHTHTHPPTHPHTHTHKHTHSLSLSHTDTHNLLNQENNQTQPKKSGLSIVRIIQNEVVRQFFLVIRPSLNILIIFEFFPFLNHTSVCFISLPSSERRSSSTIRPL